jgi:hypothetical protein
MSAKKCLKAIRESLGREMSEDEAQGLLDLLLEQQRKEQAKGATYNESLERAQARIKRDLRRTALHRKRQRIMAERVKRDLKTYIQENWSDRPDLGLESILVGTNVARLGSRDSVGAAQKQLTGDYIAELLEGVDQTGHLAEFTSGALDQDIARALFDMRTEGADMSVHGKAAREIAQVVDRVQRRARDRANKAGGNIGDLNGYIARQSHDLYKLQAVEADEWIDFVAARLDPKRSNIDRIGLRDLYNELASGVHLRIAGEAEGVNLAKKVSQSREIHFKNADAWYEYNQQFGAGNLREAILGGVDRLAETTGLMDKLGPNPQKTWNELTTDLINDTKNAKARERLEAAVNGKLANRLAEVDGTSRIPVRATLARVGAITRAWQSMAKLGGAVISAVADLPIAASELRYQGQGFLTPLSRLMEDLVTGRPEGDRREVLSSLGVFLDSMRGDVINRFSADDSLGGKMTRAQRLFFKYNGLTWWTETVRSSVALMMSHNLALNAGKAYGDLGDLGRVMSLYGIDEASWNSMRSSVRSAEDGRSYMVPDEMEAVLADKLRAFVTDRASYAVIEPDARTRSMLRQGTQPGSIPGELMRFITQFKAFPVAILQKPFGRELFGREADLGTLEGRRLASLSKALANGNGEVLGLAQLLLWTTTFGYLAMSAKDLLKGRTPRDPQEANTWAAAMLQGGALGIYGDFIVGTQSRFGSSTVETASGPVISEAGKLVELMQRLRDGDDAAASTFSFMRNNTPFINMFYSRAALDYLFFYQVQENLNPGYLRRMERRVKKENKQDFLLSPRDAAGA